MKKAIPVASLENDANYIHIACPNPECNHCESHPIDEQRHHLQTFDILDWIDEGKENETSLMKCHVCKELFKQEWNYKEFIEVIVAFGEGWVDSIQEGEDLTENEAYLLGGYIRCYTFETEAEAKAFKLGLDESSGWNEYHILNEEEARNYNYFVQRDEE